MEAEDLRATMELFTGIGELGGFALGMNYEKTPDTTSDLGITDTGFGEGEVA